MPSIFRNPKKLLKLPETALNCSKLHEIGLHQIAPNCPKLLQIAKKKSQSWPNLPKIATNSYHSNCMKLNSFNFYINHPTFWSLNFSQPLRSCIKIRPVIGIRKAHVLHQFTRRYRAFRSRARDCPCTLSDVNTSILASGNASYSGFAWTTVNGHTAEPDIFFRRCTQMCHCHCHYTTLQRLMLSTSSQMYQDRFPFPSV